MLSYSKSPPLWLPLAFFAAAALWLLAVAPLWWKADAAAGRLAPQLLALVHALALGVLGNVMLGAALQLLAVVAGVPLTHPRLLFWPLWLPLQGGVLFLLAGFVQGMAAPYLLVAMLCLGVACAVFCVFALGGILASPARDATSCGIGWAALALVLVSVLGVAMLGVFVAGWSLPLMDLLLLHQLWAAYGWLFALVAAVALTVIPLFMITPPAPARARYLHPTLLLWLGLCSMLLFVLPALWWPRLLLPLLAGLFALLALYWLQQSRRPADPVRRLWQLSMLSLLLAQLCVPAMLLWPDVGGVRTLQLTCGWLWLGGFALSAVIGMLYKIVPFLLWLQLKQAMTVRRRLPSMHAFIGEREMRYGGALHLAWLLAGLLWCTGGVAGWLPAVLAGVLAGCLLVQHGRAWRRYRASRREDLAA